MTSNFYFTATSWFPGNVRVKPHSKHSVWGGGGGGEYCGGHDLLLPGWNGVNWGAKSGWGCDVHRLHPGSYGPAIRLRGYFSYTIALNTAPQGTLPVFEKFNSVFHCSYKFPSKSNKFFTQSNSFQKHPNFCTCILNLDCKERLNYKSTENWSQNLKILDRAPLQ